MSNKVKQFAEDNYKLIIPVIKLWISQVACYGLLYSVLSRLVENDLLIILAIWIPALVTIIILLGEYLTDYVQYKIIQSYKQQIADELAKIRNGRE